MKISFIVLNYKSEDDIIGLVSQINGCNSVPGVDVEIIIVDNDYSPKLESNFKDSTEVIYIKSPGNSGFAAGNNLGIKYAIDNKTDIVVAINNDIIVPKDLISKIISSDIKNKNIGVVGGLIYFAKGFEYEKGYKKNDLGKVIWYGGGKIDWNNVYVGHNHVNEVDTGTLRKQTTPFVTGCLFITKSEVLQKSGLFDEKYCMYLEDADLCERIKKKGYQLIFDPNIKIWHKVAQGSSIGSSLNDYFLTRNRLIFGLKYASLRARFALIRESIRKLLSGTTSQKKAVKDFYFKNYGWGSWKN